MRRKLSKSHRDRWVTHRPRKRRHLKALWRDLESREEGLDFREWRTTRERGPDA